MQGMLDNLSQPVAFATVPLGAPDTNSPTADPKAQDNRRDGNLSSDTDIDEPIFSKFTRKIGMTREGSGGARSKRDGQSLASSSRTSSYDDDDFEDFLEEGWVLVLSL